MNACDIKIKCKDVSSGANRCYGMLPWKRDFHSYRCLLIKYDGITHEIITEPVLSGCIPCDTKIKCKDVKLMLLFAIVCCHGNKFCIVTVNICSF